MTTNVLGSLNNVLKDVREEPVVLLTEHFRKKCQEWFHNQCENVMSILTMLATVPEKLLRIRCQSAEGLLVSASL